jgi:hypothetical protein
MLDLTPRETEAALWCIHTVSLGYCHEPPDGSVLDGLKHKLLENAQPAPRKAADIPAPVVVVEGRGW